MHGKKTKGYSVHRFVYECFNGIIPDGKVIDHVNNIKDDNRLCNLQLMTHQENCKKSAKRRDYTFTAKNHQNKKCVKATNSDTNEVSYYNSMCAVQQHLSINAGIVKMVCEGINNCKTGISKKKTIVITNLSMLKKMNYQLIIKNQQIYGRKEYLLKTKRSIKKKL